MLGKIEAESKPFLECFGRNAESYKIFKNFDLKKKIYIMSLIAGQIMDYVDVRGDGDVEFQLVVPYFSRQLSGMIFHLLTNKGKYMCKQLWADWSFGSDLINNANNGDYLSGIGLKSRDLAFVEKLRIDVNVTWTLSQEYARAYPADTKACIRRLIQNINSDQFIKIVQTIEESEDV